MCFMLAQATYSAYRWPGRKVLGTMRYSALSRSCIESMPAERAMAELGHRYHAWIEPWNAATLHRHKLCRSLITFGRAMQWSLARFMLTLPIILWRPCKQQTIRMCLDVLRTNTSACEEHACTGKAKRYSMRAHKAFACAPIQNIEQNAAYARIP